MLGFLGKIGKGIAKGVGAITGISDVVSGIAGGEKQNRMSEAELQALMNQANNRAQLDAAQFNAGQEGSLIRRALASRMLGDMQVPSDPRAARFASAGPSSAVKDMLMRYGTKADQDVMGGGYRVTPTMSAIPKSGKLEKLTGALGLGGGLLKALGGLGGGPDAPKNMGQASMAPNLPYQPLPRADVGLPSEQWAGGMPMPSGDPRTLEARLRAAGSTPPIFPPLSGVRF